MGEFKRPLTVEEAARICAALPLHLKPLMEHVRTIEGNCWNCDQFSTTDGRCATWDDTVPMSKRKEPKPDCFRHIAPDPF